MFESIELKRTSSAIWVKPRWLLDPRMVCVYQCQSRMGSPVSSTYLARSRDTERRDDRICAIAAIRSQDTFNKW